MNKLGPAIALVAALLLAGCSSGTDTDSAADSPSSSAPDQKDAAEGAGEFCDEIEAAGATGASFGPVLVSDPAAIESAVAEGDEILAVTPPDDIAEDWTTRQKYIEALGDWSEAGGPTGTMPLPDSTDSDAASQRLTDYFFATCG